MKIAIKPIKLFIVSLFKSVSEHHFEKYNLFTINKVGRDTVNSLKHI